MSDKEEKASSPFDDQTDEDETIALSKDELDDILSEAEIVDEKKKTQPVEAPEEDTEAPSAFEEQPTAETPEEEFDISGEIDELTAEDLEKIELEDSDLESFTEELEGELGEEPDISEIPGLEEEGIEIPESSEDVKSEAGVEEEVDLDSYLDSVETDIDLDSLDLEKELAEPPVLGEEEEVSLESATAEISEGEEIQDLEEEAFSEEALPEEISLEEVGEEIVSEELPSDEFSVEELATEEGPPAEEAPSEQVEMGAGEEDVTLVEPGGEEMIIPEETAEEFQAAEVEAEDLGFEGEITLDEEEEKILNEDFDLETVSEGEAESEEVVSVSGEELETMSADAESAAIDADLLKNISTVLKYMDTLLGNLPEEKIKEFSQSEYFSIYRDVFEKLNLVQG